MEGVPMLLSFMAVMLIAVWLVYDWDEWHLLSGVLVAPQINTNIGRKPIQIMYTTESMFVTYYR